MKVTKAVAMLPVTILGTDAQGRTLVTCPECHEPSPVNPDTGEIRCPLGEAINDFLRRELAARIDEKISECEAPAPKMAYCPTCGEDREVAPAQVPIWYEDQYMPYQCACGRHFTIDGYTYRTPSEGEPDA